MYTVFKFLGKMLLVATPSLLLIVLFIAHTEPAAKIRHQVLEDKINRLILSTTTPRVIAAGDSRAQTGFVPKEFTARTGLDSANVAIGNGTLEEAYDALEAKNALTKGRIILISISSDEVSDYTSSVVPVNETIARSAPLDMTTLHFWWSYYDSILQFHINDFQRFARGDFSPDKTAMDPETFEQKGFSARTDILNPTRIAWLDATPPWYIHTETYGLRARDFLRGIDGLGHSGAIVFLFKGPISPAWRPVLESSSGAAVEAHFDEMVEDAIAPYPNIHFVDFSTKDISALPNSQFADIMHLNEKGAIIFTSILALELSKEHLLK